MKFGPQPAGAHRARSAHPTPRRGIAGGRRLVPTLLALGAMVAAAMVAVDEAGAHPPHVRAAPPVSSPVPQPTSAATSPARGPSRAAAARAAARSAVARTVAGVPDGAAGVAATDLTTGATATAGSSEPMWTASLYKLLVLETLLRENGPLSGSELDQATTMIEQSDNAAGYDLWEDAGGNAALTTTLDALHMTHSTADGTDPTFTLLTPADALKLVLALECRNSVLSPAARQQALGLMRNVEADQRWGVGVVADPGTDFANKNGWLAIDNDNDPDEDDDDRWAVTSVGVVTVGGHQVLIAAMSEHNPSMQAGIDVVQSLARSAVVLLGDRSGG